MLILPTGRVQSQAQRPDPLRPQHRPCAYRMAIGYPAKSGCLFLYTILPIRESNRRLSVRTPSDCSIGHALAAWQAGILQSKGSRFCMLLLPTEGSYRRSIIQTLPTGRVQSLAQRPAPLRPQYRPCACRIAIGHPAKSECPFLYAILPTEEANRRLSVQPPSGRSIGHALAA